MLLLLVFPAHASTEETDPSLLLWYRQPASAWTEALPIGNGELGAMVFGGVEHERLQLNIDTLWAGSPIDRVKAGAHEHLAEARRLLFDGKYVEGQRIMQEHFMAERLIRSYQTLGDLHVSPRPGGRISEYRRQLDLDTAIATTSYVQDGVRFTREVFSSPVDKVLVVRMTCDQAGGLNAGVRLDRPGDDETVSIEPVGSVAGFVMRGRATQNGAHPGVEFEARVQVIIEGGSVRSTPEALLIDRADAATILIAAETTYRGADPAAVCSERLRLASERSFQEIRRDHIAEHRRLFRRVSIDLGGHDMAREPTAVRLQRVQNGGTDPDLLALYFQYGRYLLISCSRPGTMPSNLQGLWNEHIEAPWNADYHLNINTQMHYWPAEVCNLSECHEPFFDLIDGIRERGRRTARELYDCGGFVAHHTTDAWWFTVPIGRTVWGLWPYGGAWSVRHLWEHFEYTGDGEFLEERAYPAMKEAAEFFLDYLVEDPETGRLVGGPSSSPENRFRTAGGQVCDVAMGNAMDQQIIADLFESVIAAAFNCGDHEFAKRVLAAHMRLARPRIGSDGRLMEWSREFEEPEPGHRHMSHLYVLHPGSWVFLDETPGLLAAARKSLEYRLAHGGGHTGWSRAWLINFFARLQDGEKAHEHVLALLRKSTLPNLFDDHPPFQIDGNFGATAGVAEMFLQSQDFAIRLLPALPAAWPAGEVRGLRARGGFEIDIAWSDGRLVAATIRSSADVPCRIDLGSAVVIRENGRVIETLSTHDGRHQFQTSPGGVYTIEPHGSPLDPNDP
jgi:alpha-L-fucosidase 2